ncbi:MAG: 4-(cytidine 5'-diphospho)-2-C-methyl-D-erythritol kinase [Anaeroplasmataceae bacterium]
MVVEFAYAKINLCLKVMDKLDNNYHKLESIMFPLSLHDTIIFEKSDVFILNELNPIENNIITKTAKLFLSKYNINDNVKITLIKRIPIEAGLGGGSSDSSATLRGLNRLFNLNLSLMELDKLAKELGSDNSFCLYNKPAIASNRGEELEFLNQTYSKHKVILIKPSYGLSTKLVFDNYKISKKSTNSLELVLSAIEKDNIELINSCLYNDLESSSRHVSKIHDKFIENYKKLGFIQTGSGPTIYKLVDNSSIAKLIEKISDNSYEVIITSLL